MRQRVIHLNLKQLEAFVMIADNKSFSLTAEKLYLTQPTVSAYISKLESELGEKLFYRTTKEVALTEAGKKIYIYAKDIIELAEKILQGTEEIFSEVQCASGFPARQSKQHPQHCIRSKFLSATNFAPCAL